MQLVQNAKMGQALIPVADAFDGTKYTDVFVLDDYDQITFVINKGAGATGTTKITCEACDDVTPTTQEAMPFYFSAATTLDTFSALEKVAATGKDTTAGADQMYLVTVTAEQVRSAGRHATTAIKTPAVRLKFVEQVNDPCTAGIVAILTTARFKGDTNKLPTAIA